MRRYVSAGALAVALGCAPMKAELNAKRECVTPCGLHGPSDRCTELAWAEHDIVKAFDRYIATWTAPEVCGAFAGWTVKTHKPDGPCAKQGGWTVHDGNKILCVVGFTDIEHNVVTVLNDDWHHNALAHELVHATMWRFYRAVGHCYWKENGIKKALEVVTGSPDNSDPELECLP